MDNLDRKILQVLQADARTSLQDIGQAVGLSASPCWGRIKKMEEAGVIEGYTVRLNAQALGLGDTVMVQVTLDSHSKTPKTTNACCANASTRSRAYATANPALFCAR